MSEFAKQYQVDYNVDVGLVLAATGEEEAATKARNVMKLVLREGMYSRPLKVS